MYFKINPPSEKQEAGLYKLENINQELSLISSS